MATARKRGDKYRCLLYLGKGEDGKRKHKSFTAPTKREAERLAAEYEANMKTECNVKNAAEDYINSKKNVISPSTLREYKCIVRNRLDGKLGSMNVSEVTNVIIQKAINEWAVELSPKSVRNAYGFLYSVLKFVRPDFAVNVTLPQKQKTDFFIPSEEDMRKMFEHLRGSKMELPFLLASQLGLRASEIRYVMTNPKKCIKGNSIVISNSIVLGEEGFVEKGTKTLAGNRTIPCSDYIIGLLNKEHDVPLHVSRDWKRAVGGLDVQYCNFHALRHYFASKALLQGIPKEYIIEMMGHSSPAMIDKVYFHTFPDAKNKFQSQMLNISNSFISETCNQEFNHKH